jgi:fatty-acyl-CoA synthase
VLPTLCRGGTVVLQQAFNPDAWLAAAVRERINYAFVVPTMLYALLDHGEPRRHDLSVSACAPACARTSTTRCGGPACSPREVGEVCVRSRVVMTGYRNQPEQTAAALEHGWLHTGDLAVRDEDGFFHLVDRKKDVIVSGAFNVYPREIEDVIATCAGVSTVAVIGVPDDKWGEAVTALITVRPGEQVNLAEIEETVRDQKGPHQAPKKIQVLPDLPKTPAGKIDKKAFRRQYWPDQQRQIH